MFIETGMYIRHSTPAGVAPSFSQFFFYKRSNPLDLEFKKHKALNNVAEQMPAASNVYRNNNVHKTCDSGWSRIFLFTIHFYKHSNPPDLFLQFYAPNFMLYQPILLLWMYTIKKQEATT